MVEVAVKHLESVASGKAVDDLREQEKKEEKSLQYYCRTKT
jgi:hypothetical protein